MTNVKTMNFLSAERFIRDTIGRKGIGAVIGEKGSGKTHIKRQVIGALEEKKGSYAIIDVTPMSEGVRNITQIMSAIIQDISGEGPRHDSEARRRQLRRILGDSGSDIILAIDEAQDLHKSTLRGLKKLHELGFGMKDRLFSIILFGQPSLKDRIADDELRPRFKRLQMSDLTAKEKALFIENHALFTEKALDTFLKRTKKTPLAVITAYEELDEMRSDLDQKKITEEMVNDYFSLAIREALAAMDKSYRRKAKEIEETTGEKISPATVHQYEKGNYKGNNDRLDDLMSRYVHKSIGPISKAL
ncbi:MAG: ATP-binding protein [Spirochaetes bacterium]|nr:MAG: ATP-binding protein [Spirochaetota bacterium]